MTRRLDPMDRVKELGDASVPFRFDVHAIIYSDDAPTLENKLHHVFKDRRVNRVNNRNTPTPLVAPSPQNGEASLGMVCKKTGRPYGAFSFF